MAASRLCTCTHQVPLLSNFPQYGPRNHHKRSRKYHDRDPDLSEWENSGILSLTVSQILTYKAEGMTWYFRASPHLNIVHYLRAWDVVLRNLGKGKDANSRIAILIIKGKKFDLFRHLLGRGLWDKLLEVSLRELVNFKGRSPLCLRMNNFKTHKTTERQ